MKFSEPLISGHLVRRYKRFLADITLDDGSQVTAHCPNSGSMLGCNLPGSPVWITYNDAPHRKLKYTWQLIQVNGGWVGINTGWPNKLVAQSIQSGMITELAGYSRLLPEQRVGERSRIDLVLEEPGRPRCYVEVKNVTLAQDGVARFPDAVTERGSKHLRELKTLAQAGNRAAMVYVVQREDCHTFSTEATIDPTYTETLRAAIAAGVEVICYGCLVGPQGVEIHHKIPFVLTGKMLNE